MDYLIPPPDDHSEDWKKDAEDITKEPLQPSDVPPFVKDVENRFLELGFTVAHVHDQNVFHELFYNMKDCLMIVRKANPDGSFVIVDHVFLDPKRNK